MAKLRVPVFSIEAFGRHTADFYANTFSDHLRNHHFIKKVHKHDFYITVLFTKGTGTHEIDFSNYPVKPGRVFFLSPGQMHNWKFSNDIEGLIFFHSAAFFELYFPGKSIRDFAFFSSVNTIPYIDLDKKSMSGISGAMRSILEEYTLRYSMWTEKAAALMLLTYVDLGRIYKSTKKVNSSSGYLDKFRKFEALVDSYYKKTKSPLAYAEMMSMTEKHLNRICRECVNKTTGQIISERVLMEAKRLLTHKSASVSGVADELGFDDKAYFSRLFRKHEGLTAMAFSKKYR
ncbi:MAG TPA: helix-turn-helix transcriptional regulator [Flavobacteriales bacterium]|nr:helix-turn-helix transcriptional regulator [Flavobacteriales bacterium]